MVYEIVVRDHLSPPVAAAFDEFALSSGDGVTSLTGEIVDQAALHGVIDRIEQLGLVLVELHPVA